MNHSFFDLEAVGDTILSVIIANLDIISVSALAETNRHFREVCFTIHGEAVLRRPLSQPLTIRRPVTGQLSALVSTSNIASMSLLEAGSLSSSSSGSDDDSVGTADTGLTTPEDHDWFLKVTPDLTRRLSLLPHVRKGPTLEHLPAELQLEIFSHLDKIDSTCLGLASPNLYPIFRAIHGTKIPLNTRRIGPNILEAAWELVGKQKCKQCGVYRCELYQHIKTWMPQGMEYCAFKQNFGLAAAEQANATCYRGKPSKPKRCGRHPLRTTSMHQDDRLAMTPMTR